MEIAEDFVKNFIKRQKQSRYLSLISSRKGFEKFQRLLDHGILEDMHHATLITNSGQNVDDIAKVLIDATAENSCHLFSSNSKINEKDLETRHALDEVVGYGFGTILIFRGASIAYYESEERGGRYFLQSVSSSKSVK